MHGEEDVLRGQTIGVTAERKAEEFGAALARRGADVRYGTAMQTVPLPEDGELAAATSRVLAQPVDYVVAITGVGFRGWLEAAASHGRGEQLIEHLRSASLLARGAKARGAVRGAGLRETWTAPSEESDEILEYLINRGVSEKRVVVQLHGAAMGEFRAALSEAGGEVIPVRVYRWIDPVDLEPLDQLIAAVVRGEVDALPFTSAPAATNLLDRADRIGQGQPFRAALADRVLVACVGPVTAAPIEAAGIPCVLSERPRIASLVRLLAERLPAHGSREH